MLRFIDLSHRQKDKISVEVMICATKTAAAKSSPAKQGWHASLELEIVKANGKSVVGKSRQNGPLTIQSPFYPEDGVCHLYLLHPPAGIVGGDVLELSVSARQQSSVLLTTPGATKFYKTNSEIARQDQCVRISDGSSLELLPQETIYYPEANASLSTTVYLEGGGQYFGWELHCFGLPARGDDLRTGTARVGLSVYRDNILLLRDCSVVSEKKKNFQAAFMRNCPVYGSFIMTGGSEKLLETLRSKVLGDIHLCGATLVDDLIILRYLGSSVLQAKELFLKAWKLARPLVLGKPPVPPRIWQT
jgi:urease accessory protein